MNRNTRNALGVIGPHVPPSSAGKRYYTIPELQKLTGLSRRQLDYWAQVRLITPSLRDPRVRGGGKPASFYCTIEALKVLMFSDLKQRGFSLPQVRQLYRNLLSTGVRLDEAGTYLLTDGVTILCAKSNSEVVDLLKHNRQMLLIPIQEQIEKLRKVA